MQSQQRIKPRVAIIFSENSRYSRESEHTALYICGLISQTNYAELFMVGFKGDGTNNDVSRRRISYISPGETKPREVPGSDVTFAQWNVLQECHILIICVNTNDTEACCEKLAKLENLAKTVPVFSLQRGVKNSSVVKDELSGKAGFTVIEAVIGFAVALDPKSSAYVSTQLSPSIVYERLTKEAVKVADGPMSLLEHMNVTTYFRKALTPYSWGVLVYENFYTLNILTGGSLVETLSKRKWRLILALMLRESSKLLTVASRGGKWQPELLPISSTLNVWLLELVLVLPFPFFQIIYYLTGMYPRDHIISPGQMDIAEGRKTMTDWHLSELIEAGKRNRSDTPILNLVLESIKSIERDFDTPSFNPHANLTRNNYIQQIEKAVEISLRNNRHPSEAELLFWTIRILALVSIFILAIYLLVHEY
eukprot:gene10655-14310_t